MNKTLDVTFAEQSDAISAPNVNRRKRILVVDDDDGLRLLILSVLTNLGYEVDEAENGMRGWEALNSKWYDLLITDNNMPQMTGLELIGKLRSAGFELPIALASGSLPQDLLERSARLRLAAVIPKPFTLDELVQTARNLLAQAITSFNHVHGAPLSRTHGIQPQRISAHE